MSVVGWSCANLSALFLLSVIMQEPAGAFITGEQRQLLKAAGEKLDEAFPGCESVPDKDPEREKYFIDLLSKSEPFKNPSTVEPTSPRKQFLLEVKYTDPGTPKDPGTSIGGCRVRLRSYNGKLVGDTIRAKPGDTLYIRVVNNLPVHAAHPHPQDPAPSDHAGHFSFNVTNLHTHGLHTSPEGISDNVLLTINPGQSQDYEIHIHKKHPTGTFWYHAHLHGSTAVQVSSGMAGALIIEGGPGGDAQGGLDTVAEIQEANKNEKVFVLQQVKFGLHGQIETFEPFPPTSSSTPKRPERLITVNGQLIPTIEMKPGEVQRWRFIHAGLSEHIDVALQGHELHEIAADGIATGRMVSWKGAEDGQPASNASNTPLPLGPGYRADVLVKAGAPGTYYLMDGRAPPPDQQKLPPTSGRRPATASIEMRRTAAAIATAQSPEQISQLTENLSAENRAQISAIAEGPESTDDKIAQILDKLPPVPAKIIARIVIKNETPVAMNLPDPAALKARTPSELRPIEPAELVGAPQDVFFQFGARRCKPDGDCSELCSSPLKDPTCKARYMIGHRLFSPDRVRALKLGTAAEWTLRGNGFLHPFHIHVNPFQVRRWEPRNGQMVEDWIWKDVILLSDDPKKETSIRMRYTRFTGKFVLHCHLLDHEDQGMMEMVEIVE